MAAAEPLQRSDQIRDVMEDRCTEEGNAGSATAAAAVSIMKNLGLTTWKNAVTASRSGACEGRCRLTQYVYDLWMPYSFRRTNFELHRPWAFLFKFTNEADESQQCRGWTTLAMLRSAHWWIQANGMARGRVARLAIGFDGNFDVIAPKRSHRVNSSVVGVADAASTVAVQALETMLQVTSCRWIRNRRTKRLLLRHVSSPKRG